MVDCVDRTSRCYSRGSDFIFWKEIIFVTTLYAGFFTVYVAFLEEDENVKFFH